VNTYLGTQDGAINTIDDNSKEITSMLESLKTLPSGWSTHI